MASSDNFYFEKGGIETARTSRTKRYPEIAIELEF